MNQLKAVLGRINFVDLFIGMGTVAGSGVESLFLT
jgi:hypothetical protein